MPPLPPSLPPSIFSGWKPPVPTVPTGQVIRRGDVVKMTEAARVRAELPTGEGVGVVVDVWVEDKKAAALVAVRLKDRIAEAIVSGDELTKE